MTREQKPVTNGIEFTMRRLKSVLATLPELEIRLGEPASSEAIAAAESELGFELPSDVRCLYELHDGQVDGRGLLFGMCFLTLDEFMQDWRAWRDVADDDALGLSATAISGFPGTIQERYANPSWLPVFAGGGGNHVGVDLDPGPSGQAGQVINFGRDQDVKWVLADDLGSLLDLAAVLISSGNYELEPYGDDTPGFWLGRPERNFIRGIAQLRVATKARATGAMTATQAWFEGLDDSWRDALIADGLDTPGRLATARQFWIRSAASVSNLEPITGLPQLQHLVLTGVSTSDIGPLSELQHLRALSLSSMPVSDLSPLEGLPQLRNLRLHRTKASGATLARVAAGGALTHLSIEACPVTDVSFLSECDELEELALKDLPDGLPIGLDRLPSSLKRLTIHAEGQAVPAKWLTRLAALASLDVLADLDESAALGSLEHLRDVSLPFAAARCLRDVRPKLSFTILGGMTAEEKAEWRAW